ncbi:MAG: hypothetical protein GY812_15090 [Actinomycetia bacterium]|nr:hypothetical protein [Actinomycetes bacterium]
MTAFVLRVWLPDRPGALGLVASRVGAVGGDVVGIDIIDRGAGRAVDELLINLPDESLVDLLVSEIHEIDGADVEDVRPAGRDHEDLAVAALQVAAELAAVESPAQRACVLVGGAMRLLHADWAAVVDTGSASLLCGDGDELPNEAWLSGFVLGATADGDAAELDEFAIAEVADHGWKLVVCRSRLPVRGRERAMLDGMGALG